MDQVDVHRRTPERSLPYRPKCRSSPDRTPLLHGGYAAIDEFRFLARRPHFLASIRLGYVSIDPDSVTDLRKSAIYLWAIPHNPQHLKVNHFQLKADGTASTSGSPATLDINESNSTAFATALAQSLSHRASDRHRIAASGYVRYDLIAANSVPPSIPHNRKSDIAGPTTSVAPDRPYGQACGTGPRARTQFTGHCQPEADQGGTMGEPSPIHSSQIEAHPRC